MTRRLAAAAFFVVALFTTLNVRAQQQIPPRDLWPQATAAAREADYVAASARVGELLTAGRSFGIKTFPTYAASASGLTSESATANPDLAAWARKTSAQLDGRSPSVAFNEADIAARKNDWAGALRQALQGYARAASNYRTNTLGRADFLIVAAMALAVTAIVFAVALFIRYGRSMAHDFREMVSRHFSGGSVSVLAFALLFLPIFLWLGPMWLIFYWFAIFFGYAGVGERITIVVLLLLVALLPIAMDLAANWIAGVDSPVVQAAISSADQSYQPEALRRLQEVLAVIPENAMLHLLMGNMQAFEGAEDQAAIHYRRAIELRPSFAGALVNLGNLHFLNNEFQAAITDYEKAQKADPKMAIAFYNSSVASGETYKFNEQAQMLEKARAADRSFVERTTRNPPPQKIVMYRPAVSEAWEVTREITKNKAARALFGNYSTFDPIASAANPVTIGALLSLLLALALWLKRRRHGFANACIKCGRTFCFRCKSSRESTTYCTQCIHIYLKRDGVSLDTKRKKLEEVSDHQSGMVRRNRLFATFLPGSAQLIEGRITRGLIGMFLFALFVTVAIFIGRLGPAFGPVAHVAQTIIRIAAIAIAVVIWLVMSLPVYRRRAVA
jgi:tetratricopeptide (TPR) repeat protein